MPKVKLSVTKNDIKNGAQSDGSYCPIALAATKVGLSDVDVDGTEISFEYGTDEGKDGGYDYHTYYAKLPKAAQKFVEDFDEDSKPVKPFSFTINIPKKVLKTIKLKKKAFVATA